MAVSLSESAAKEVKKIIADQNLPEDTVLRVGVQGGGCSGFSYSLNFDTAVSERDRIADFFGVKLAVDKKFDPYLDGTVVDFYDGLEKRGFVFNNLASTSSSPAAAAARSRSEPGPHRCFSEIWNLGFEIADSRRPGKIAKLEGVGNGLPPLFFESRDFSADRLIIRVAPG